MSEVIVVRTGIANLASVLAGLERAGAKPRVSRNPGEVERAEYVILPGVGAFGAGMAQLESDGLVGPLQSRYANNRPTMAVCLGLQLLSARSEEAPGISGLKIYKEPVNRFSNTVRVPQLGWNQVEPRSGCNYLVPGYAYFANSFKLTNIPNGWNGATADHGGSFVAAIEKGPFLACQFHPELSGKWGLALLKRWLEKSVGLGGK